ncbi:hypothetical protein EJ02DRAFT_464107 [Clathrospora elynae]|uniref:Uncharacterized protein n=1 Tax=Clathrospora elynae TaxID=706981 RepID=A0A6A5SXS1_9PLEO|nr:hypothetical protein EJ02DRAFT_464107 [Clathrospora elynae]
MALDKALRRTAVLKVCTTGYITHSEEVHHADVHLVIDTSSLDAPVSLDPNSTFNPALGGLDFDPKTFANDDTWKKYVDKGGHLLCLMQATDKGAGFLQKDTRTPPSAAKELAAWYWHDADYDRGWECDFERMGLKKAFEGQGLNAESAFEDDGDPVDGHNDCLSVTHYDEKSVEDPNAEWPHMKPTKDQKYMVGNTQYMATGAYYQFTVNHVDGAIIRKNLNSPGVSVRDNENWGRAAMPGELPDIQSCSEIYRYVFTANRERGVNMY